VLSMARLLHAVSAGLRLTRWTPRHLRRRLWDRLRPGARGAHGLEARLADDAGLATCGRDSRFDGFRLDPRPFWAIGHTPLPVPVMPRSAEAPQLVPASVDPPPVVHGSLLGFLAMPTVICLAARRIMRPLLPGSREARLRSEGNG